MIPAGRPRAAERAEAQRARILDAAQKCFVEMGFHAAPMATIAERAGISAGLIYRYFENKDAIVRAIIERELQERRARIAELHSAEDLCARLVEAFRDLRATTPEMPNAALFLEMSAEGTRSAAIAAALACSDKLTRGDFQAWLMRPPAAGGLGLERKDAEASALLMQMLVEGLVVRAAREPDLAPARIRQALERFLACFAGDGAQDGR